MKIARDGLRHLHSAHLLRLDRHLLLTALCCAFGGVATAIAADWQSTLTKDPPGDFPSLRPLRATYVFGWSGFTAANGEVRFSRSPSDQFHLDATGRTVHLARL